jgi:aminoglycoside phosphotransferase family enzyme
MSFVFLAGDKAYKLKKPVRFPYLDYSSLDRRETACRAEVLLNRRLAPLVYLGVVPLRLGANGYSIDGSGETVDWLVCMRRLESRSLLDQAIREKRVDSGQIARVTMALGAFYKRTRPIRLLPDQHRRDWERHIAENRAVLVRPDLGISSTAVWRIDRIQRRMLSDCRKLFAARVRDHRIVDGHICLSHPPQIIDCLEFSPRLRSIDPFDEIAFLSIDCERLGAGWIGRQIAETLEYLLRDRIPEPLYRFYRCYRATLRARLTIAHLLEPHPRTPQKWRDVTRSYLDLAEREALWLERWLSGTGCPRPTGTNDPSVAEFTARSARPGRGGDAAGKYTQR